MVNKKEEQFHRDVIELNNQVNQGVSKFFNLVSKSKDKVHNLVSKTSVKIQVIKMYLRLIKAFKSGKNPKFALFFEHPPSMLLLQLKNNTLRTMIDKEIARTVHEMIYSPMRFISVWYYKNFIEKVKMLKDQDLIIEYLKQVTDHINKWLSGAYPNKSFIIWPKLINPCSTIYLSSLGDLGMSTPRQLNADSLSDNNEFKVGQYIKLDEGTANLLLDLLESNKQGYNDLIKAVNEIKGLINLVKSKRSRGLLVNQYDSLLKKLRKQALK